MLGISEANLEGEEDIAKVVHIVNNIEKFNNCKKLISRLIV